MKKKIISFLIITIFNLSAFSQSVYMHEAQEDARRSTDDGISSFLGILTLIGMGLFVVVFIPLMIGENNSNANFRKKSDRRRNLLDSEALDILNTLAISDRDFAQIIENPKWKDWYLKGYHDGVDKGETESAINEKAKPLMYELISWEDYSERRFAHLSSEKVYINIECGGDVRLSKLAYDEGRRNGIRRKKEKGDLREMLD